MSRESEIREKGFTLQNIFNNIINTNSNLEAFKIVNSLENEDKQDILEMLISKVRS